MNVLTIAGSDPSSGAGIQGDLKTFASFGVYGLTVITALTSQNSSKFLTSDAVRPSMVRHQIKSVLSGFRVSAIKIGMVYDRGTISAVHGQLKDAKMPIILDPVFESSTGGKLLREHAFPAFRKLMVPLAFVITPNVPEAERISGMRICSLEDAKNAAKKIQSMGARNVVIKGGHLHGSTVTDLLLEGREFHVFSQRRISRESHGGGCLFSAALCATIAKGYSLVEAVRLSQKASFDSIKSARKFGRGLSIAVQRSADPIEKALSEAIGRLCSMEGFYRHIPEVQTNFVYSGRFPRGIKDILGLEGRIVRTGTSVQPVGSLKYGGSQHVASAVLEVSKRFPATRSALNMRYDELTIQKAAAKSFRISSYERKHEPRGSKGVEGRTVTWGVGAAISKMKGPPDIVYHKGGQGKEPMILLFGKSPGDVLSKLARIT